MFAACRTELNPVLQTSFDSLLELLAFVATCQKKLINKPSFSPIVVEAYRFLLYLLESIGNNIPNL